MTMRRATSRIGERNGIRHRLVVFQNRIVCFFKVFERPRVRVVDTMGLFD